MLWIDEFDFICFDFDGVLVNTEKLHCIAYQKTIENHGLELDWDFYTYCTYAHVSTEVLRDAVYKALPKLQKLVPDWEDIREQKTAIYLDLLLSGQVELMPGVAKILHLIEKKKKNCCVVTNSTLEQIRKIRQLLPTLDNIPNWITREDYDRPKPYPDGYQMALKKHASKNDQSVGFEDTIKGYRALKQTSILPVLICEDHHPQLKELSEPILHFSSFEKIYKL